MEALRLRPQGRSYSQTPTGDGAGIGADHLVKLEGQHLPLQTRRKLWGLEG